MNTVRIKSCVYQKTTALLLRLLCCPYATISIYSVDLTLSRLLAGRHLTQPALSVRIILHRKALDIYSKFATWLSEREQSRRNLKE